MIYFFIACLITGLLLGRLYANNDWFQNLKKDDKTKNWFNFRGTTSLFSQWIRYEFVSGNKCKLQFELEDGEVKFVIAPILFAAYISITAKRTWPKRLKDLTYINRTWGFYFFEWALVWQWNKDSHSSGGKKPWYKGFYFNIDDFFLGNSEHTTNELTGLSEKELHFIFRGKDYVMDSVSFERLTYFRRNIPFALYNRPIDRYSLKISKPPGYAGKGENSWDCDDDATYGQSGPWDGPPFIYQNREAIHLHAIRKYCEGVSKNIRNYGTADNDKFDKNSGVNEFQYIGHKSKVNISHPVDVGVVANESRN